MLFEISSDQKRLQFDRILQLLANTYWAHSRSTDTIQRSIENSVCYGAFLDGVQVGFARVVTDYATTYYICDVIVDPAYRGRGFGKFLIQAIVEDPRYNGQLGILATRDTHKLYEQFGFRKGGDRFMCR